MSLYQEISRDLATDSLIKEIYRFQGARTHSKFDLNNQHNGYIYYSNSLDHHKYFTLKRLKQMFGDSLLRDTSLRFNSKTIGDPQIYSHIKNLVINTNQFNQLRSFRITCSVAFDDLIKENALLHENKYLIGTYPEKVDRRVFGGGYGISDEWRRLLSYLTFFIAEKRISREELLQLLSNMRTTGKVNKKDNIDFLLNNSNNYNYHINPNIFSTFNKYQVIEALEKIIEKRLLLEDSLLAKHSQKTIKEVVSKYEKGREKVLSSLDGKRYY